MQETQVQFLGLEDSLEEEMATDASYSYLGHPMDRGAWWAKVHVVTKSQRGLSDGHTHIIRYNSACAV